MAAYIITAGQLNQRVSIESKTISQGDNGEPVTAWSTVGVVWAKVKQLTGRDQITAQQVQYPADIRIVVRYRSDISPQDHRLQWQGRPYEIVGWPAQVGPNGEWLEVMATHGVRDGR